MALLLSGVYGGVKCVLPSRIEAPSLTDSYRVAVVLTIC